MGSQEISRPSAALLADLGRARVGIVGDLIVDVYILARPSKLSREAPVLVVDYEGERVVPGGAANALANLAALGARVHPVGVVGDDEKGRWLIDHLKKENMPTEGLLAHPSCSTVTKTRVMAGDANRSKQQVLRLDRSSGLPPPRDVAQHIVRALDSIDPEVDAWLVSDYGYGALDEAAIAWLRNRARHKPVIVDSHYQLLQFQGVTAVTPNLEEAEWHTGIRHRSDEDLSRMGRSLMEAIGPEVVLLTLGNRGMIVFERGQDPITLPICGTGEVTDVAGAGDTVAAVVTLAWVAGAAPQEAAILANVAAGIVVTKSGAASVTHEELAAAMRGMIGGTS